jgi:hypothetical protein
MNLRLYNLGLYSLGLLSLSGGIFIYGTSIIHRKYCVFCGKEPPCLAGRFCNATRLEGKVLRYFIKNISK